jgi:hypothetical protein
MGGVAQRPVLRTAPCFARSARALSADRTDQFYIYVSHAQDKNCSGLHNNASTENKYRYSIFYMDRLSRDWPLLCSVHATGISVNMFWFPASWILSIFISEPWMVGGGGGGGVTVSDVTTHIPPTGSAKEILISLYTVVTNMYVDCGYATQVEKLDWCTYV